MKHLYAFLLLAFCITHSALGQKYLQPDEYMQRLNNGLQLFYTHQPNSNQYQVLLAFRFGSVLEDSTTDGLAYVCHTVFLNELQKQLHTVNKGIKLNGRFGQEVCTYQFSIGKADFAKTLDALAKHFQQLPDNNAVALAISQNATLFGVVQNTLLYPAEQTLLKRQWGARYAAMSLYGQVPMADSATISKVTNIYGQSYCLELALMVYSGPEAFRATWGTVQDKLGYITTCGGKNMGTEMANLFPKPRYSNQVVYNVGNATPSRYQKMYHGPYTAFDGQGTVTAQVFKLLLAQSKALASLADSMGMAQLRLANDPMTFTSSFTWHVFPKQNSLHSAYGKLDTLIALLINEKPIPATDIEAAKTMLIDSHKEIRNSVDKKPYLIAQYWAQRNLDWLDAYPNMVEAVNHEQISKLLNTYVVGQKHSTLLLLNDADSTTYDVARFATTYTAIEDISFTYQKNTADFATTKEDSTLNALAQTLLINPKELVVMNSEAYKSEILDVKDDSLATTLRQYPDFYLYPKNLLSKSTFRLDIYRSATIMLALLQRGVSAKQISGTGSLLKEKENEHYQTIVRPVY